MDFANMNDVNLSLRDLSVENISIIMRNEYKFDEEIIQAFAGNLLLFYLC